jgi:hypothetical protein
MQRQVMNPFRAPRQAGKKDTQVHVVPYRKGLKLMREREADECAQFGEVQRWSTDSGEDGAPEVDGESEEPTEFGVVWERYVIKETEEAEMDPIGGDMARQMNKPHTDGIVCNGEQWMIAARKERTESGSANLLNATSQVPSPSLSDFEAFLGDLESERSNFPKDTTTAAKGENAVLKAKNHRSFDDDFWENVLQKEKVRLENDLRLNMVPVDDIMPRAIIDEDDVPIVSTLCGKHSNLGMLAAMAAQTSSPAKVKPKKVKEVRWTYEIVNEPTGVGSKYWDAEAPTERTTKRMARQKISALNVDNIEDKGIIHTQGTMPSNSF